MASSDKRISALEKSLTSHLVESGGIQTTLKDLGRAVEDIKRDVNKAFWTVVGASVVVVTTLFLKHL